MKQVTRKWLLMTLSIVSVLCLALGVAACNKVEPTTTLDAPVISLNDETGVISWNAVNHATNYVIYENNVLLPGTVTGTEDVITYKITQTVPGPYTYEVAATSTNSAYKTSAKSNPVTWEVPEGPIQVGTLELCDSLYDITTDVLEVNIVVDNTTVVDLDEDIDEGSYVLSVLNNDEGVNAPVDGSPVTLTVGQKTYDLSAYSYALEIEVEDGVTSFIFSGTQGTTLYIGIYKLDDSRETLDAPENVKFKTGNDRVLTWDEVGEQVQVTDDWGYFQAHTDSYAVYKDGVRVATVFGTEYLITDSEVGEYEYTVTASPTDPGNINTYKESAPSASKTFTVGADSEQLAAPSNFTSAGYALNWDAVENAYSYNIYADGVLVANIKGTSYTMTGAHSYQVQAVSANAAYTDSELSAAQSFNAPASNKLTLGGSVETYTGAYNDVYAYIEIDSSVDVGFFGMYYDVKVTVQNKASLYGSVNYILVSGLSNPYAEGASVTDYSGDTEVTINIALRPERVLLVYIDNSNNVSNLAIKVELVQANGGEAEESGLPELSDSETVRDNGLNAYTELNIELKPGQVYALPKGYIPASPLNLVIRVNSTIRDAGVVDIYLHTQADGITTAGTKLDMDGKVYTTLFDGLDTWENLNTVYLMSTSEYALNVTVKLAPVYTNSNQTIYAGGLPVELTIKGGETVAVKVAGASLYVEYTIALTPQGEPPLFGWGLVSFGFAYEEGTLLSWVPSLAYSDGVYAPNSAFTWYDEGDMMLFIVNQNDEEYTVSLSLTQYIAPTPKLTVGEYYSNEVSATDGLEIELDESVTDGKYILELEGYTLVNSGDMSSIKVKVGTQIYTLTSANENSSGDAWVVTINLVVANGITILPDGLPSYDFELYVRLLPVISAGESTTVFVESYTSRTIYFDEDITAGSYTITITSSDLPTDTEIEINVGEQDGVNPDYTVRRSGSSWTKTITVKAGDAYIEIAGITSSSTITITITKN